jgi:2'-5' RNA ligase
VFEAMALTQRLFFGICIPNKIQKEIELFVKSQLATNDLFASVDSLVDWRFSHLHITLLFCGTLERELKEKWIEKAKVICQSFSPFHVEIHHFEVSVMDGQFRSVRLYFYSEELERLKVQFFREWEVESNELLPHCTIAYAKKRACRSLSKATYLFKEKEYCSNCGVLISLHDETKPTNQNHDDSSTSNEESQKILLPFLGDMNKKLLHHHWEVSEIVLFESKDGEYLIDFQISFGQQNKMS